MRKEKLQENEIILITTDDNKQFLTAIWIFVVYYDMRGRSAESTTHTHTYLNELVLLSRQMFPPKRH